MSVSRSIVLHCDWPLCNARFDRGYQFLASARKEASKEGWKNFRGLIDLCGNKDLVPEWDDTRARVKGHALGEHLPKLTARGTRLSVACQCGWSDPDQAPTLRTTVKFLWSMHVREATQNA